jgi:hypothetical protein
MGLWQRFRDWMREGKERDAEVEKQAVTDRHMRDLERAQREQTRGTRLPPRGDRG